MTAEALLPAVVSDNERWLHQQDAARDLKTALAWLQSNPPSDSGCDDVLTKLNDET